MLTVWLWEWRTSSLHLQLLSIFVSLFAPLILPFLPLFIFVLLHVLECQKPLCIAKSMYAWVAQGEKKIKLQCVHVRCLNVAIHIANFCPFHVKLLHWSFLVLPFPLYFAFLNYWQMGLNLDFEKWILLPNLILFVFFICYFCNDEKKKRKIKLL